MVRKKLVVVGLGASGPGLHSSGPTADGAFFHHQRASPPPPAVLGIEGCRIPPIGLGGLPRDTPASRTGGCGAAAAPRFAAETHPLWPWCGRRVGRPSTQFSAEACRPSDPIWFSELAADHALCAVALAPPLGDHRFGAHLLQGCKREN